MSVLANPVMRREFVANLRSARALAIGLGFIALLCGLALLMWPSGGVYSLAAQSSHRLFSLLPVVFLTMAALVAPAFTAVSVTTEKERRTFDMLYDSLLSPSEIVAGKFVGGAGFTMLLILASLPAMFACYLLGGVSPADVALVYLVVFLAAWLFGLLGLWCSLKFRTSYTALVMCYVLILLWCGATWIPAMVVGSALGNIHLWHAIRGASPYAALLSITDASYFASEHPAAALLTPSERLSDSPWPFLIAAAAVTPLLGFLCLRRMALPPNPPARRDARVIDDRLELFKRHVKFPFYLFDPRRRKRMIPPLVNVVAAKEMRSKAFARTVWLIRSLYVCFGLSLCLAFLPLWQAEASFHSGARDVVVFTCIAIPLAIASLIGPVLTATAVTGERESGVFDALRSTRVTPLTFVLGKLQVSWLYMGLLLASALPSFFVLAYIASQPGDMERLSEGLELIRPFNFEFRAGWEKLASVNPVVVGSMFKSFGVVAAALFFSTAAGACASAFAKRSSTATAAAYCMTLFFTLGTLAPHMISDRLPKGWAETALTVNPFAAVASAASAEAFGRLSPDMWILHLAWVFGLGAGLTLLAAWRVGRLMRPE